MSSYKAVTNLADATDFWAKIYKGIQSHREATMGIYKDGDLDLVKKQLKEIEYWNTHIPKSLHGFPVYPQQASDNHQERIKFGELFNLCNRSHEKQAEAAMRMCTITIAIENEATNGELRALKKVLEQLLATTSLSDTLRTTGVQNLILVINDKLETPKFTPDNVGDHVDLHLQVILQEILKRLEKLEG